MKLLVCSGFFIALLFSNCNNEENTVVNNSNDSIINNNPSLPPLGAPVETNPANNNYQPAFAGQTRVGSVSTQTPISHSVIVTGISSPWGIIALPDGRLLITKKSGSLAIYSTDGVLLKNINGLPNIALGGQGGLLDVAVDPNFSTNRMVYYTFSMPTSSGNLLAVGKGMLNNNEDMLTNNQVIFQATPSHNGSLHFGGRLIFDAQGYLYVSSGERSDMVTRPLAQDQSKGLGKIFKIDTNGNAAPNNPYINQNNAMPQIFSLGHRNPQGLALHPITQKLWETEMGPYGGDEINLIESGKNYGWPIISYGLEYSGSPIGSGITQQSGLEQPKYYWNPSVSPSGMDFYTGNAISEWKNNLFIGMLSGQHIVRIVFDGDKVYGEERLLSNLNERFRDILASHPDGNIYAITDSGKIIKIYKS